MMQKAYPRTPPLLNQLKPNLSGYTGQGAMVRETHKHRAKARCKQTHISQTMEWKSFRLIVLFRNRRTHADATDANNLSFHILISSYMPDNTSNNDSIV